MSWPETDTRAPGEIEYCDFIDAEPPPRELGSAAKRYVRVMSTYFRLGMMIFFVTAPGLLVAVLVPKIDTIIWAIVLVGLTVWLARATSRKRRRLRLVAIEGRQAPARVVDAHELVVRRGLLTRKRVTLVLEVEGRRVTCRSWAGDFEGLTRGHWMRVLTHAEVPELVIPVASVT